MAAHGGEAGDGARPPRGPRGWIVQATIIGLLLGSIGAIVTGREIWPFSPYPMYAGIQSPTTTEHVLVGIVDGGEVPVPADWITPFDGPRLAAVLARAAGDDPHRRDAILRAAIDRYEARRAAGEHDGPALRGLRLHALTWTLDVATMHAPPDERVLIAEYVLPDARSAR